jgi:hypothetical protein
MVSALHTSPRQTQSPCSGFPIIRDSRAIASTASWHDPSRRVATPVFSVFAADRSTLAPFPMPPLITVGYMISDQRLTLVEFPSAPGSCLAPSSMTKLCMLLVHVVAPVAVIGHWFLIRYDSVHFLVAMAWARDL